MSSKRNTKTRSRSVRVAIVLAGLLFGIGAVSLSLPSGTIGAQQLMAKASDALKTLVSRSPGERTAAVLAKSKAGKSAAKKKRQRNIPGTPDAPAAAVTSNISDIIGDPDPILGSDFSDEPDPEILTGNLPPLGGPISGGVPIVFGGSGGGPGGGGGGGSGGGGGGDPDPGADPDPVDPIDPVVPAIPEPETWALMLLGFGLIGWALRRARKLRTAPEDQTCGSAVQ